MPPRAFKLPTKTAFTLLEVMVSIAVFSLMAIVVLQTIEAGMQALEATRNRPMDEAAVRFLLTEALKIEERIEFEDGGDLELPDERVLSWQATIEPTETLDLHAVTLTVSESGTGYSGDDEPLTLRFLIFRKNWYEDPGDREQLLEDRKQAIEDRRALTQ